MAAPDLPIPQYFARRMGDSHREAGRDWLRAIIAECGRRWSLAFTGEGTAPSWNYVVPGVTSEGEPVVLKVGYPAHEVQHEIDALAHYDGCGAVRLLEAKGPVARWRKHYSQVRPPSALGCRSPLAEAVPPGPAPPADGAGCRGTNTVSGNVEGPGRAGET